MRCDVCGQEKNTVEHEGRQVCLMCLQKLKGASSPASVPADQGQPPARRPGPAPTRPTGPRRPVGVAVPTGPGAAPEGAVSTAAEIRLRRLARAHAEAAESGRSGGAKRLLAYALLGFLLWIVYIIIPLSILMGLYGSQEDIPEHVNSAVSGGTLLAAVLTTALIAILKARRAAVQRAALRDAAVREAESFATDHPEAVAELFGDAQKLKNQADVDLALSVIDRAGGGGGAAGGAGGTGRAWRRPAIEGVHFRRRVGLVAGPQRVAIAHGLPVGCLAVVGFPELYLWYLLFGGKRAWRAFQERDADRIVDSVFYGSEARYKDIYDVRYDAAAGEVVIHYKGLVFNKQLRVRTTTPDKEVVDAFVQCVKRRMGAAGGPYT